MNHSTTKLRTMRVQGGLEDVSKRESIRIKMKKKQQWAHCWSSNHHLFPLYGGRPPFPPYSESPRKGRILVVAYWGVVIAHESR